MEYISRHKCIKDTYINATALTAHQLNRSGVPDHWKGLHGSTHNWVGQKKGGRRGRRASGTGPALGGEEAEAGKRFLHLAKLVRTEGKNLRLLEG